MFQYRVQPQGHDGGLDPGLGGPHVDGSSGTGGRDLPVALHGQDRTGEEEFVYVWTLGIEGVGDGSDKLVTVDVRRTPRPSAR